MNSLAGKVALVTGASRGIGRAIAERFASEGARVVICGRKQDTLDEVARASPGIVPIACHVGRSEQLTSLVQQTRAEVGEIDILVNNAATNIAQGPSLEMNDAQFDKMVELNLKSAFRLVNLIAPEMCSRGRGSIVNIASVAGLQPQFHSFLYSMTKAALIMMTKSWAQEFGRAGVRVNAIAPGLVRTTLSEYYWKDETRRESFLGRQPIRRIGEPADIAETALLLAGTGSAYLTGQVVVVDGGLLIS
jgi:NAD(P)-dependent dehydrogenase (short-subunit alcohol dehydrogenase family)